MIIPGIVVVVDDGTVELLLHTVIGSVGWTRLLLSIRVPESLFFTTRGDISLLGGGGPSAVLCGLLQVYERGCQGISVCVGSSD